MSEDKEELCPEIKEYLAWYDKEALPRIRKWGAHLANCPKCQKTILPLRDSIAFALLRTTDDEIIRELKKE